MRERSSAYPDWRNMYGCRTIREWDRMLFDPSLWLRQENRFIDGCCKSWYADTCSWLEFVVLPHTRLQAVIFRQLCCFFQSFAGSCAHTGGAWTTQHVVEGLLMKWQDEDLWSGVSSVAVSATAFWKSAVVGCVAVALPVPLSVRLVGIAPSAEE